MTSKIEILKKEFQVLVSTDATLAKTLGKENPYGNLLGQKILDLMLLLRFIIDVEEAEIKNPIGVKVTEKPKLAEVDNGAN